MTTPIAWALTLASGEDRGELVAPTGQSQSGEPDGLYAKYYVARMDNRDLPGGDKWNAQYFVLDYANDPHARTALRRYAQACALDEPKLALEIIQRLMEIEGAWGGGQ